MYERILRIPYYAVFDRYTSAFRMFKLDGGRYAEVVLEEQRFWIAELELGLGLWQGQYQNIDQLWLRWYDTTGNWVLTPTEKEQQRTQRLIAQLRRREAACR